jgi:hypothetical protein
VQLTNETLIAISALGGAFIGGFFGFLTAWISKRSEERRSLREVVMRVASEQRLSELSAALQTRGGDVVFSYHVYLMETLELSKILTRRRLTPKKVSRLLDRAYRTIDAVVEHSKQRTRSRRPSP